MKSWEIAKFEITHRLRQISTWIYFVIFVVLAVMVTTGTLVDEARRAGDLVANGPASIAVATIILGWLGLVVTAGLFTDAALRDVDSGMQPLFAATPVRKIEYLGGRFVGALAVNALVLSAIPLGLMLAAGEWLVDPELLGPFNSVAYIQPFFLFLLPNLLLAAALTFGVAALTRRSLPAYGALALLFLASMVTEEVLADGMGRGVLAAVVEPFGFTAVSELWQFWTPFEKNTRLIVPEGALLWNRLLWPAVAVGILAVTVWRFRLAHHTLGERRGRRRGDSGGAQGPAVHVPHVRRSFGARTLVRQTLAITRRSLRELLVGRESLIIVAALLIFILTYGPAVLGDDYGTPYWPVTGLVARLFSTFLVGVAVALLIAFYAGELVWGERDARMSDITDAAPLRHWVPFAGKFIALGMMLVLLQLVMMLAGMILQAITGHFDFQPGLYARILFGIDLPGYLIFAALAMFVHVLVNQKAIGHVVVILAYVFTVFSSRLGITRRLLVYGTNPGWVYSDVSGFGPFLEPYYWFTVYWAGWALLLAVLANLFWVHGREGGILQRLRLVKSRFTRPAAFAAAAAAILIAATGSFIFYNTEILNEPVSAERSARRSAEYERRYAKYGNVPQPHVTRTRLHVEIFPSRREVEVRGTYTLVNDTNTPVDAVHLFLNPEVETRALSFDRTSRVAIADQELGHHTYALQRPLRPGESLDMMFDVRFAARGFRDRGINTSVVGNGTYFDHTGGRSPNHRRWLPVIGYQSERELSGAVARREQGLDPRAQARPADDPDGLRDTTGRETIHLETIIGTAEDQTAVAPGTLRRSWTENGRRYFHYATETPMRNSFAILSAKYAVHRTQWNDVPIEIYHHPGHTFTIQRIARSLKDSLAYYTENFGPYPYPQIRVVEFPRYANLAHAYGGLISFAEGMGFLSRVDEKDNFDTPYAVISHEVAHQWWGQQVVPAPVEGAPVVTEVLAQYSTLMVLEKTYGREMPERFLRRMRIEYLNRRGTPSHPEVPLLKATTHPNLVYRKGPMVMYALREAIGEERVNRALRRLVEKHGHHGPPFTTSHDLYRELREVTPDELQPLLADLFEDITLWNLRATEARAEPIGGGAYRVTLQVEAKKLKADGVGRETEVPMHDWIEIGVFSPAENANGRGEPLYLERHWIGSGAQTITVTVPELPARAGIDPHLRLIDRNIEDNVTKIPAPVTRVGVREDAHAG